MQLICLAKIKIRHIFLVSVLGVYLNIVPHNSPQIHKQVQYEVRIH